MKKRTTKVKKESKIDAIMRDNYTGDDVKRYIGAVTEEFRGHVSAVAEQFLGLNEKVDHLNEKVDRLDTKLSSKIDTHTEMIGRLMTDVEEIKIGMHEKVSRQEFNKLETRLFSLETIVFSDRGKRPAKTQK